MRKWLFILMLPLTACGDPAKPQEPRPDMMAKSLCECSTELLNLNRQAASDSDSLAFRKIASEFEKVQQCVRSLNIKPEEKAAFTEALKKLCPDLAKEEDLVTELLAQ